MILTCPECGTQYVVKDGAIPAGGRQVRCASCKHSWHQDPPGAQVSELDPEAPAPDPQAEPAAEPQTTQAAEPTAPPGPPEAAEEPGVIPRESDSAAFSGAEPEAVVEPAYEGPMRSEEPRETEPAQDDEFAPFGPRDHAQEPRTGFLRPLLLVVLLVAAIAAAFWFLAPPEWKARVGLAQADETPLQLMMTHSDRQPLASGNELLAVTGRVINPTERTQSVPPIHAQLRSNSGQLVHSWTIAPPARSLPPGASATFNSAEVNVPAGGDQLTITLVPPRA